MGLELSDATLSCRKSLARGVRVLAAGLPFFCKKSLVRTSSKTNPESRRLGLDYRDKGA